MLVSFDNHGFEQDGYRYMTEGAFMHGGIPKVRVGLFKQNTSGDYERIDTVSIRRGAAQSSMKSDTIVKLVKERRLDLSRAETHFALFD